MKTKIKDRNRQSLSEVMPDLSWNWFNRIGRPLEGGEVFTPPKLIYDMINKASETGSMFDDPKTTMCDPACGTGNIQIVELYEKLNRCFDSRASIWSIYGADIQADSIRLCRARMLFIISQYTPVTSDHVRAVLTNIVCINIKDHPGGSLDYEMTFDTLPSDEDIKAWLDNFLEYFDTGNNPESLPVRYEEFISEGWKAKEKREAKQERELDRLHPIIAELDEEDETEILAELDEKATEVLAPYRFRLPDPV